MDGLTDDLIMHIILPKLWKAKPTVFHLHIVTYKHHVLSVVRVQEMMGGGNMTASNSPNDGQHKAVATEEQYAWITAEVVALTPPEATKTMYRLDETAYKAACGRKHLLRLPKPRQRPLTAILSPSCVVMLQHGRGMKNQASFVVSACGVAPLTCITRKPEGCHLALVNVLPALLSL